MRYRILLTSVVIAMSGAAQAAVAPAGCHAFDFEYGKWKMPNERLIKRLVHSHQWEHFYTYDVATPLPGCVGDIDIMRTDHWPHFVGVTIRTYDPKTGLWRIYWVDNRSSNGEIQPPVVGSFKGNVGLFYGKDAYNGIPILVRFTWTLNPKGSKAIASWSQAFSTDGGKTWEVNWRNDLIPDTR
ncbi:MAG: hypothetical protein WBE91_05385 [Steroidobacteraceae bacterium]